MQDLIQKLVSDHASQWKTKLQDKLGFGPGQSQSFVQGLIEKTIGAFSSGKLDLSSVKDGLNPSELMQSIDLGQIAAKAGLDVSKAQEGVEALAPELSSALGEAVDGESLVQGLMGKAGGLLGNAADPVAKLFGK